MMRPSDPRFRQTINQISHNLESANETAQEGIYTFSHNYIGPCFAGIKNGIQSCTAACLPTREDQLRRRRRGRSSVRAEFDFDFYDDWDYDEDATGDGLLGWGTDELDRLLAGSGAARSSAEQPRSHRRMSYGARGGRRKSAALPNDERRDPTVIPSSSFLGFLEKFPWRIGARGIRYRPSAADLQENPGGARRNVMESEPLIEGSDESDMDGSKDDEGLRATKTRLRSGTQSSRETSNSLSSRGDLLPSDDEEDAVPLDDEFTMTLGRRDTGWSGGIHDPSATSRSASGTSMKTTESSKDSRTSGKGKGKRRRNSRRTISSKSPKSPVSDGEMIETTQIPSMLDLKKEEELARYEEELEIERKRQAAQKLARERGLSVNEDNRQREDENNDTTQDPQHEQQQSDDSTHEAPSTTVKETRTHTEQALQSPDLDSTPKPSDNRDTLDQES